MYKNENGKNILMNAEEEAKFLADQKAIQDREKADKDVETAKANNKASGKQKLKDLGLDDNEIEALVGK